MDAGIGLTAAGLLCGIGLLWHFPVLPEGRRDCAKVTRDVSVIIPARNEEANLTVLLTSLSAQRIPPREVLVVDDGSTDGTADAAAAFGARVIRAGPLPPGWQGKAWACHQGARQATGGRLLFLDADVRLAPDALERLSAAQALGGGAIAVQPYHEVSRPYERLSAICNAVVVASLGAAFVWRGHVPAGAFGPCLLCTVEAYRRVGGHEAAAGRVMENFELGRRLTRSGEPLRLYIGGAAVKFRMYPGGLRELAQGWTKTFAAGAGATQPVLLIFVTLWIAGMTTAALQPIHWASGGFTAAGAWTACASYAAYALHLALRLRAVGRFGTAAALLFPAPLAAFLLLFVWSSVRTFGRRQVAWRGRTVSLKEAPGQPLRARKAEKGEGP